jgi:hypothetical protein
MELDQANVRQKGKREMRLIAIPPYRNPAVGWGWVLRHLVDDYRRSGGLEGVEVDVDEGYLVESTSEARDEEVLAVINVGIINKVKEYARTQVRRHRADWWH